MKKGEYLEQSIPLPGGRVARLFIPGELRRADMPFYQWGIDYLLKVIEADEEIARREAEQKEDTSSHDE